MKNARTHFYNRFFALHKAFHLLNATFQKKKIRELFFKNMVDVLIFITIGNVPKPMCNYFNHLPLTAFELKQLLRIMETDGLLPMPRAFHFQIISKTRHHHFFLLLLSFHLYLKLIIPGFLSTFSFWKMKMFGYVCQ